VSGEIRVQIRGGGQWASITEAKQNHRLKIKCAAEITTLVNFKCRERVRGIEYRRGNRGKLILEEGEETVGRGGI